MRINKTQVLIGVQAILIILLFWIIIFLGKDEYASTQNEEDEAIESQSRVSTQHGLQIVALSQAAQKNSGIQVQPLQRYEYQDNIKVLGTVISIQPLIDYNSQYQALKSQLELAQSTLPNHLAQYKRYKLLNEDDKNVSDKVVQDAYALVQNNQTQIDTAKSQLKALNDRIIAQWGEELVTLVTRDNNSSQLHDLLVQKRVLVQVSFPLSYKAPSKNSTINITPIHESVKPLQANYVSQSLQTDLSNIGKTYFYSAPADYLRIGMRVNVIPKDAEDSIKKGVRIPNSAIVWHGGMAWIYVETKAETFLRKPITADIEIEDGWFDQSFDAGTEIVTKGAQLLLSEELKFSIKNENDD